MLELWNHSEGIILPVRAQPGARKSGLKGIQDGRLKVAVTQPPEQGKANQAILETLRKALKLKRSQIELFGGETSREKKFLIRDVSAEDLIHRIESSLSPGD